MEPRLSTKIFVGIDYSMSSPALCYSMGGHYCILSVSGNKFISPVARDGVAAKFFPIGLYPKENQMKRFEVISDRFVELIGALKEHGELKVAIEDYSMGSKGKVFHIAENTAVLKYRLWKEHGVILETFAPMQIKKHATGKGNADKFAMAEAFKEKFGWYFHEEIKAKGANASPASDCVDAFYVCDLLETITPH